VQAVAARQLLRLSQRVSASGNFRLDRRAIRCPTASAPTARASCRGNSEVSRLYQRVSGTQAGLQMPPTGALPPDAIRTIKLWIEQGADWPDELAGETPSPPQDRWRRTLLDAHPPWRSRACARLLKQSRTRLVRKESGGITPLDVRGALWRHGHPASAARRGRGSERAQRCGCDRR
jgi:hypothetical protein